jgi:glutathione S-transferase
MRASKIFPFDKVPCMFVTDNDTGKKWTLAQSGSIARFAAKLAGKGCYPDEPVLCTFSDHIFELAQEMCTINPMINCFTGAKFRQVKEWYFTESFPENCGALVRQLALTEGPFFCGEVPTFGDFNVFHMLSNALMADAKCLDNATFEPLRKFCEAMQNLDGLKQYLENRPDLVGIGSMPSLVEQSCKTL